MKSDKEFIYEIGLDEDQIQFVMTDEQEEGEIEPCAEFSFIPDKVKIFSEQTKSGKQIVLQAPKKKLRFPLYPVDVGIWEIRKREFFWLLREVWKLQQSEATLCHHVDSDLRKQLEVIFPIKQSIWINKKFVF